MGKIAAIWSAQIEQSFGVKFSEDELVQATTIGTLAHIAFAKLEDPVGPQCLSAFMFYKRRRAFIELLDIPRTQIVPEKSLYELMPWTSRKKQWRTVQNHMNCVLPPLTWTVRLLAPWLFLAGTTLYVLFGSKMLRTLGAASVVVGAIGVVSVSVLAAVILNPLGKGFPRNCETFGDLVKLALAHNDGKMAATHGMSSEKEAFQSLLRLVAAETATDIKSFLRILSFLRDLKSIDLAQDKCQGFHQCLVSLGAALLPLFNSWGKLYSPITTISGTLRAGLG